MALQGLERYEEAMVAFAEGLAADPKQAQMLSGLTETVLKSPLRGRHVVCMPAHLLSDGQSTVPLAHYETLEGTLLLCSSIQFL